MRGGLPIQGPPRIRAIAPSASVMESVYAAIRLMWQVDRVYFISSGLTMVVTGIVPLIAAYASAQLLSRLAAIVSQGLVVNRLPLELGWWLAAIGACSGFLSLLGRVGEGIQELYQRKLTDHTAYSVAAHAASLDLSSFEDPAFYNKLQNASGEATQRPLVIVRSTMQAIAATTTLVSAGMVIVGWHIWILPLCILAPGLGVVHSTRLSRERVALIADATEKERLKSYFYSLLTSERDAKEIRFWGVADFFLRKLEYQSTKLYRQYCAFWSKNVKSRAVVSVVTSLDRPLLLGAVVLSLLSKHIVFSELLLITQAITLFQGAVGSIGRSVVTLNESSLFTRKLYEFLSIRPVVEVTQQASAEQAVPGAPIVEMRNVCFSYPSESRFALKRVNLEIRSGEIVALVGANGSGKSTLVKMLAGFYNPSAGVVRIEGRDTKHLGRKVLREHTAILFQDYQVFNLTARENIGIGDIKHVEDTSRVARAAELTGFLSVATSWPEALESRIGKSFSGGCELSGGERQLLAISRVLLRGAKLVVLDEPTAALDCRNADRLATILGDLRRKGKAVLCVSHRSSLARLADRVIVMGDGEIVGCGSHSDLISTCGSYAAIIGEPRDAKRCGVLRKL